MTVAALYLPSAESLREWTATLRRLLPGWAILQFDDVSDRASVEFAVVWKPPPGRLAGFPNLRAIVSIGSGIDHVLADPEFPRGVPIIRTVGQDLTQRMCEYVALHVLRHHRDMPRQLRAQAEKDWHSIVVPTAPRRVVGVMGLGYIGASAARLIAEIGFAVRGWAKSVKAIDKIQTFAGPAGLAGFLDGCEILVNLLPLTQETEGILNAGLFRKLPKGACVINCARGQHLVEEDLLAALSEGHIKQATLDVFREEPLPATHPFWAHPAVTVTPHIAARINAETGGQLVARNLRAFAETGTCPDLADPDRGY